ncbi:MAG: hypothetical protein J5585_03960 [Clostridia bacterium]|nr:hypothetical protein [Clostridia bacterium]
MKKNGIRIIAMVVSIVFICLNTTSCFEFLDEYLSTLEIESDTEKQNTQVNEDTTAFQNETDGSNVVNIHVDVEQNLIFSKYDVDVFLDTFQKKVMTVTHGKSNEISLKLSNGTYKICFRSAKKNEVVSNVNIDVTCNIDAYYSVHCESDRLVVKPYKYDIKRDLESNEIRIDFNQSDLVSSDISDVLSKLKKMGCTNIVVSEKKDVEETSYSYHKVISITIDKRTDYADGSIIKKDAKIEIVYHESKPAEVTTSRATTTTTEEKGSPASYHSSNDRDVAKQGNSGIFAYRNKGTSYYIYYVIDFDNGYVYRFLSNEETAEKVKIISGDLNSYVLVRYKSGNEVWENALHFKYKNKPETLILQDDDRFDWTFNSYSVIDAVKILNTKKIYDYSAK